MGALTRRAFLSVVAFGASALALVRPTAPPTRTFHKPESWTVVLTDGARVVSRRPMHVLGSRVVMPCIDRHGRITDAVFEFRFFNYKDRLARAEYVSGPRPWVDRPGWLSTGRI